MERMLRNKSAIILFLLPALLLYTAIVFIPIVASIYFSFFKWDVISPMKFIGMDNYTRMFTRDSVFFTSIKNMMILLFVSLVIQQGLGFLLAILITGSIKGKEWFKNIFFFPAVISSVAVGMMWSFIYNPEIGMLNKLLDVLGMSSLANDWLSQPDTAMWAVSFVVGWQYLGYTMILYIAAIQNIPAHIFESARIDGAVGWKVVWHMTIPLVQPIMKVTTILITIGSLKFFDLVFVMTGGGPANQTQVLASYLYGRSFRQFEYGYGDALSVILLLMCLVATVLINMIFRKSSIEY
ncbi:putative ABC transporter permease protein YesP [Paenibacillus nuruki]|uniref:Putative ABC transporter permease protein YesP n=1 Tax=Paenibacillus nuruki TaxID=1886670 RepID=A0A1E3L099_9BACL|nr:sugar ABC transporter permease [Paenibacillus nuruki]ODP27227.1 putative ABC transporter permease protein YesP [Paenibacillus nuruki]